MIGADPAFYLRWTFDEWSGTAGAISETAFSEYDLRTTWPPFGAMRPTISGAARSTVAISLPKNAPRTSWRSLPRSSGSEQVQLVTIAHLAADHLEAGARSEPGPRGRDSVPHLSAGSLVGLAYQSLDEIEQVLHHERLGQKG
jgi:hypothetical protein